MRCCDPIRSFVRYWTDQRHHLGAEINAGQPRQLLVVCHRPHWCVGWEWEWSGGEEFNDRLRPCLSFSSIGLGKLKLKRVEGTECEGGQYSAKILASAADAVD
jgi:hypothetical protein